MTPVSQRAFAVWWKDLERWIVPARLLLARKLPKEWSFVRVRDLVRQVSERLKVEPNEEYKMVGVRWYGEGTFHRETVKGDSLSATYVTPVIPDAFIYNRLFAWKGSFAVVPEEHQGSFVSNEFPQFIIDKRRLLPLYLYLFFMCDSTVRAVDSVSIGSAAVSRNRFKEEDFLNFKIPLPPLTVQHVIVGRWEKAQREIAEAQQRSERLKAEIDIRFFRDLGLTPPHYLEQAKCFGVWWKDFLRWSVTYNKAARAGADLSQGKYPVIDLGSVLELVQYGTSEKANTKSEGIPILRINNVKDSTVDLSDLKYVSLPTRLREGLLLKEGDILIIRTSGSRNLVGACAVFHEKDDYVFASYLIRLRVMIDKVIPDFVSWFLNSALGRQQIDATSRQIMQNNINSTEIAGLQIPLPPLTTQQTIMRRVEEGRSTITQEKEKARCLAVTVEKEIEEMVLGVRPVPETVELRKLSA